MPFSHLFAPEPKLTPSLSRGGTPPVVYLVEDDRAVQESLAWALRRVSAEIIAFSLPSEILNVLPTPGPSCLLVDFHLPEMDGLKLFQRLRDEGWGMPFIVISGFGDVPVAVSAMRLGAIDFLQKPVDPVRICELVEGAIQKDQERIAIAQRHEVIAERLRLLTKRELDVLDGVIAGQLNKQIAVALGIKVKTVETHRANLTRKLEVGSVAQLVAMMVEHRQQVLINTRPSG